MDDAAQWTLDELSELAAGALRVMDYQGQPSRRVREVPDRRTIRWYTTIGLLDRPAAMRGRTALYGRRHLTQLVAVKRLQALGHSLVQVQSELVGATDAALESIARIPADLALSNGSGGAITEEPVPNQAPVPTPGRIPAPASDAAAPATRSTLRFWAAAPAGADTGGAGGDSDSDSDSDKRTGKDEDAVTDAVSVDSTNSTNSIGSTESTESTEATGTAAPDQPAATAVPALRLGSGVTLLLGSAGRTPTDEDARLIDEAARPLLDLLLRRGLDAPGSGREIR